VSRRVSLPGASELFRPTNPDFTEVPTSQPVALAAVEPTAVDPAGEAEPDEQATGGGGRASRGSGRVRHDEKITVYVSSDELLALERARLQLRAAHGLAVDRGRIVREAIAAMLADLDREGDESQLVRRLS
jgi:hypothetical protein